MASSRSRSRRHLMSRAACAATAAVLLCGFALPASASAQAATGAHQGSRYASRATARSAGTPSTAAGGTTGARQGLLADEQAASVQAQKTGRTVVVTAETNTGTLVTANPNGSFTVTVTSEPVRVRQHGVWVPIDPALISGPDGMLHAKATATAVAFSRGGTGPMVTMTSGADRLSFTFPYRLPRPAVSGPDATYGNVLPGVDLQLTANASGFSELLIVRTRAAAASAALRALRLHMTASGVTVHASSDGGAQAVDRSGATVFHTDTATMWDSTATSTTAGAGRAAPSAAQGPLPGAHVAMLGVRIGAAAETLVPSASLLTSPRLRLPLYIDPAWTGNPSQLHWARISDNGWNIYNSTSTAGADHPRAGWDDWPGGAAEMARTYYQMATGGNGTSGIQDADVTAATLTVNNSWAASSSSTPADVYKTGGISNWDSSGLNWSNKPTDDKSYQDQATSYESGCPSACTVHPGQLQFSVVSAARQAASGDWANITFDLRADNESHTSTSADEWKQFASGGGARLSYTYFRTPDLVGGDGSPTTTPTPVTDNGTNFVTSATPTMKITAEDTDGENVYNIYEVWNGSKTTEIASYKNQTATKNGSPETSGTLADGSYAWRAQAENSDSTVHLYSPWSAWQSFTVDTSDPPAPGVESPQFPLNQFGAAYSDQGTFTFTTDGSDNVKGYMFSLDGDLGTTVYGNGSNTTLWTAGTKPVVGTVYFVPASPDPNGPAQVTFAPGTVGPHRVFAKAVDQADNTSKSQTTYEFWAGFTTPSFVYGDQLVNGYTATDGTVVPAGTASLSGGGQLVTQANCCSIRFADGYQAMLGNGSGKINNGDSMTLSFEIPTTGVYDLGANLTQAHDYGSYTITLNANSATGTPAATLLTNFDAYNSYVTTTYRNFGVPTSNGTAIVLPKGVYSITLKITGQDSSSAGYQAGIDVLRLALMSATCSITSLSGCYDNTGISSSTSISQADADGDGGSLAADQLATAGWTAGAAVTIDGAPMTLPSYAPGVADNIVAGGQTVTIPSSGYANDGNAIVFLAFGTYGTIANATGTITYTGLCNQSPTQNYSLTTVPDWLNSSAADVAAKTFPGVNRPGNPDDDTSQSHLYAISVPLACIGQKISSITLPVVSNGAVSGVRALHILALGIRPASFTDTTNSQNWVGTWAAKEGSNLGSLAQTTIRMPAVTSLGGTQLRIHLSNALGTAPVTFDHVTVAQQSSGAQPVSATMTDVKFGGNASVTIPAGGDVTSDPVTFTANQRETLLVSLHTTGTVAQAAGHAQAGTTSWTTSVTTDQAGDTSGSPFNQTTTSLYWLTGVDVTSAGNVNGTVAFWGDQTINSDTSSGAPNRFTDDVMAQLAAGNTASPGNVPYGVLNLGQNSSAQSNNLLPVFGTTINPVSATDPVDRDLLQQANVRTVLISSGTSDILAGDSVGTVENNLITIASEIRAFTADTPNQNPSGFITVYVATIPPSSQFTAAEETIRETVNQFICGASQSYLGGNADGCIDFAAAVASNSTDTGSTVNTLYLTGSVPNNGYYQALANAYVTQSASLPIGPDVPGL
jgi:hypothetical protein